jgi:hypothetical protein
MATELTIANYTVAELAEKWQEGYADYVKESLAYHNDDDVSEADIANVAEEQTWNWMRTEFGAFGFDDDIEEQVADLVSAAAQ